MITGEEGWELLIDWDLSKDRNSPVDWVKEETSEPPKAASESPTEPQQHPELTGTFAAPTGTSSSRLIFLPLVASS